jgi:hypothetical protein
MHDKIIMPSEGNGAVHSDPSVVACINLLEQALTAAKMGQITSVAIVSCMHGGFGAAFAGTQGAELNLGLDSLKKNIIEAISNPKNQSKIVRARPI